MIFSSPLPSARLLFVLLIVSLTTASSQFQNGNAHRGIYESARVYEEVAEKWVYRTGGAVRSSPILVGNSLYVGSSDGTVYCLNAETGAEVWKVKTDGAVGSTPLVQDGVVYVATRSNTVYALRASRGELRWKKSLGSDLPYVWGFDYFIGSASIDEGVLYVGSGDGHLYALQATDGKERWKFRTTSRVRSTPAIDAENVYVGDCLGKVFAVNKRTGDQAWRYSIVGDTLDNENFGYDRNAVIASATLAGRMLLIGGRDGFLYALDARTGREIWRYDYEISWVLSTVAVKDGMVVSATSDGQFIHALSLESGKERWRFRTRGPVWASPAIASNDRVVVPSNDGNTYCLDLRTGSEVWRWRTGPRVFSSPALAGSSAFVGSDDGNVYCLETTASNRKPVSASKRAVFWMKNPVFQAFRAGMDVFVRDYFIREGYEFYDETDIGAYLRERIASDTPSVLVFATNIFLPEITKDSLGSNLLKRYLERGGKVVLLGVNPAVYAIDFEQKTFAGFDFSRSFALTGIPYPHKDLRSHKGFMPSFVTEDGRRWGLTSSFVGLAGRPPAEVTTVLALDETGNATAWVKAFHPRPGSGFVQLNVGPEDLEGLKDVREVAEFGLR